MGPRQTGKKQKDDQCGCCSNCHAVSGVYQAANGAVATTALGHFQDTSSFIAAPAGSKKSLDSPKIFPKVEVVNAVARLPRVNPKLVVAHKVNMYDPVSTLVLLKH